MDIGNKDVFFLSNVVDSVSIVKLESSNVPLIGPVKKVIKRSNGYYLSSEQQSDFIFEFDLSGNFVRTIGKLGRGPEEHTHLTDFDVNPENGEVYIYDNTARKILKFDKMGNFIEYINIDFPASQFAYNNGFFYLERPHPQVVSKYSLNIYDRNGQFVASNFPEEAIAISGYNENPFCQTITGEGLYLKKWINDTIYRIDKDELRYAFAIDFGKFKLTEEDRTFLKSSSPDVFDPMATINYLRENDRVMGPKKFFEFDNTIIVEYVYQMVNNWVFYNKTTAESISSFSIIDDLTYINTWNPSSNYKDHSLSIYYPENLHHDIQNLENLINLGIFSDSPEALTQLKSLQELTKSMDTYSLNPYIVLHHFKK